MGFVEKTIEARRDAHNVWLYIADDNMDAADALLEEFNRVLKILSTQPHMGEARPQLGKFVRIFPVGAYLLIYEPIESGISLIRILHGARHLPSAMYN